MEKLTRTEINERPMKNESFQTFSVNDVLDVANYFLSKDSMQHKKLQKLCYYAQSWFLANYGTPMFPNRFEAWVHGPVSPDLYSRFRRWGWMDIPKTEMDSDAILDERAKSVLDNVYKLYGKYTADQLELMTHKEDPWITARGTCAPNDYCRNPISMSAMRNYYGQRIGRSYDRGL